MAGKVDFKKTLDAYRASAGVFRVVDVPRTQYLMADGHGDPNTSPEYVETIESLYPVAYKLKFASKESLGRDYVVPPLEGLWWARDMSIFTTARDKSQWDWTMMLMVPDWIDEPMFAAAVARAGTKKPPPRLGQVRLETLTEGKCVQTLHIGSFDDEADILAQMHEQFIPSHGLEMVGKHHEIYLSDLRRVTPERLRTILRQPVQSERAAGRPRMRTPNVRSRG